MITVNGETDELTTVNNRLQHKVKDLNSDYKMRLAKYIEDIAVSKSVSSKLSML